MTEEDPYKSRRGLSFAQAEGAAPLPQQLQLKELSEALRVRLHRVVTASLRKDRHTSELGYGSWVAGNWNEILFDLHTLHWDRYADDFKSDYNVQEGIIGDLIKHGTYIELFDTLQYILSHRSCPYRLDVEIETALKSTQAAYRVIDRKLIVPVASEGEGAAVVKAFADLAATEFNGARRHLANAAKFLTTGDWAASVRESIHAVEAVAKLLEPSEATLAPALNKLAKGQHIHPALKDGFAKLYGYTSDEKGIRHSLLEDGDAKVDEADALYMFGACAAFITYLISKARAGSLLT